MFSPSCHRTMLPVATLKRPMWAIRGRSQLQRRLCVELRWPTRSTSRARLRWARQRQRRSSLAVQLSKRVPFAPKHIHTTSFRSTFISSSRPPSIFTSIPLRLSPSSYPYDAYDLDQLQLSFLTDQIYILPAFVLSSLFMAFAGKFQNNSSEPHRVCLCAREYQYCSNNQRICKSVRTEGKHECMSEA